MTVAENPCRQSSLGRPELTRDFSNVIRYSIMRVRAVWVPFNCPTILYSQWFSLMSHFFGGFLSVFSTIFREDAISFPDAGKLWLHLLNGKWHSQLTLPLIHNWFREFEKHNPWFWIIASFRSSVMKLLEQLHLQFPSRC